MGLSSFPILFLLIFPNDYDKNNNDTDKSIKFKTIGSAYETLINNISRNKYDRENNIINNYNTTIVHWEELKRSTHGSLKENLGEHPVGGGGGSG